MASKFTSRTPWRVKLEKDRDHAGPLPKVVPIPPKMAKRLGAGTLLIPRPLDVDAEVRKVRPGKLITVSRIRQRLADRFGASTTCPLCTGIFLRIAAEAAEEDRRAGKTRITPYWRVVRDNGGLNEKFPGGVAAQSGRLRAEGHTIEAGTGKKTPRVRHFEKALVKDYTTTG